MPRRLRLADRTLAALVAEGFLSRLSFGLVSFALPLYARRLGMSLPEIGLLVSFNLVVAIPLKPAGGWLADRVGLKQALSLAIFIRSVVSALLIVAHAPWHLFAIRAVHGLSIAVRDPATAAMLAESGGSKAVASSFAWYQTAKTVAGSIGKAAAGLVLALSGSSFAVTFAVALVLSTLPLGVVLRWVSAAIRPVRLATEVATAPLREEPVRDGRLVRYLGLGFLVTGSAYMLVNLFPILAIEYGGLSEAQTGSLYLLSTVAALSGPAFGWLSDRAGPRLVLSVRSVANIASSLLYLFTPNLAGFATGRALDDMGKAAFRPAWGALMASASSDPARRARTMGVLSIGEDAGEIVGPVAAGFIWNAWGVPALLLSRMAVAAFTEWYTVRVAAPALGRAPARGTDDDLVAPPLAEKVVDGAAPPAGGQPWTAAAAEQATARPPVRRLVGAGLLVLGAYAAGFGAGAVGRATSRRSRGRS